MLFKKQVKELEFDFKKSNSEGSNKKSKFFLYSYYLFIGLTILDMSYAKYKMTQKLELDKINIENDLNNYSKIKILKSKFDENKFVDVNKLKIELAKNFNPQSNIGKFLLLNEYSTFKINYYQLDNKSLYSKDNTKEISDFIRNNINTDTFNLNKYKSIDCNISITCYFMDKKLNEIYSVTNIKYQNMIKKQIFEIDHQQEILEFRKKSPIEQLKLMESKNNPYDKYLLNIYE